MPFVISTRTSFSLGAVIALLVLVLCVVFAAIGHVTPLMVLGLIGALALALLIG